ncbi:MAG: hypothetical protein Q8N12_06415 [Thermodesulfovibrionales bacterium]|nr:hypothetical protein [Nitrospinota bacterium]MCG2709371.1 hypothetical protein [Thermodesulfovibrionales bacterium]MDP3049046.1 hypothetical protein [Thermodesulfovibrionales bacterium]
MMKIIVKPLLIRKSRNIYKKELYVSDEVKTFIQSFERKENDKIVNAVLFKLDYLACRGFDVDNTNIKPEWKGVYRIAVKGSKGDNREGRIIGFYDQNNFIAICSFYKNEQKLRKYQKVIIDKVARIKRDKQWMYGIGGNYGSN